ncbi:hypothetical protein Droror1_Dr00009534 [Drosera rotundifolia]
MLPDIEFQIVSRVIIKPSTPTPDDKRSYNICLTDQFMAPYYIPLILFYRDGHQKLSRLKESLSETLTVFYPFAGRLKDNITVDCNDEGVPFVEAQVNCSLGDFLEELDARYLHYFLPCAKVPTEPMREVPAVAIQVTVFSCGGLAIGGCYNHKIMDAWSTGCFIKYWTSNLSGCYDGVVYPDFTAATKVFPPREYIATFQAEFLSTPADKKCTFKRYLFDATSIQALKLKATSEKVPNPTRVEVVSTFMWKHAMAKKGKSSYLRHLVNIRKRTVSSIPSGSIGCLVLPATAAVDLNDEKDQELDVMVAKVHEAISRVNTEFKNNLDGNNTLEMIWNSMEVNFYDRATVFMCSSLCQSGATEFDFGWGKPVWVSPWGDTPSLAEWHSITLVDADGGKGVEAWFVLQDHEIAELERDQEFLAYAKPISCILTPST